MYNQDKVNWTDDEHDDAAHAVAIAEAIAHELKDEDPDVIDFDDVITVLSKVPMNVVGVARAILKSQNIGGKISKTIDLAVMVKRHEGWPE